MNCFDAQSLIAMSRVDAIATHRTLPFALCAVGRLDAEKNSYVHDLWRVELDPTQPPHQLTRGPHQDRAPALRADGAIFFLSNRPTLHDGEDDSHESRSQLFMLPPRGGEPVCVSNQPLGITQFWLLPDSTRVIALCDRLLGVEEEAQRETAARRKKKGPSALHYTKMPVRRWDHWLPMRAPHIVLREEDGTWRDLTPSADDTYRFATLYPQPGGRFVIIARQMPGDEDRITETILERLDLDTLTITPLHHTPRTALSHILYARDGRHIYATRATRQDSAHGGAQLVKIALDTGESTQIELGLDLIPALEDITTQHLYFTADYRGDVPIFAHDLSTGQTHRITHHAGSHRSVSVVEHAGKTELVSLQDAFTRPPTPCICAARPESDTRLLADLFTTPDLSHLSFTSHEVTSTDGAPVQYWVVKPREHEGPLPALMWIHGGPIGAWGNQWHWRWNSAIGASKGYIMVLPNPRGSTGFGQPFLEGIWHNNWGGQCYEDLMAVADAVDAREDVDATHHFAMGGSFGGYMTNWIGTQTDRFRALVNHAGLADLSAFHGVTDFPAWWSHMFGIDPDKDRDQFAIYSPLHHVTSWTSPILIIHGQQDYRVPVGEALMMFEALQRHGVESELLVYPDENHWILKPGNISSWYGHVFDFLARHGGAS